MLKPWHPLTAEVCGFCPRPATHNVKAGDVEDFACARHYDQLIEDMFNEFDGCVGQGLRQSWTSWVLHDFWLTRWIGGIQVSLHNRRMERVKDCAHLWSEAGLTKWDGGTRTLSRCSKCGATRVTE